MHEKILSTCLPKIVKSLLDCTFSFSSVCGLVSVCAQGKGVFFKAAKHVTGPGTEVRLSSEGSLLHILLRSVHQLVYSLGKPGIYLSALWTNSASVISSTCLLRTTSASVIFQTSTLDDFSIAIF